MQNRFQKIKEMGSKGKKCNPLLLEEFQWESEWVDENSETVHGDGDSLTWTAVDEVAGATQGLRGRHLPRAAAARAATAVKQTYARNRKRPRNTPAKIMLMQTQMIVMWEMKHKMSQKILIQQQPWRRMKKLEMDTSSWMMIYLINN